MDFIPPGRHGPRHGRQDTGAGSGESPCVWQTAACTLARRGVPPAQVPHKLPGTASHRGCGDNAPPQVRAAGPGGPGCQHKGVPLPAPGSGPAASESRRAARSVSVDTAQAPCPPSGDTHGPHMVREGGGLLEAPHSRQEPGLHFQRRLLGTVPPPAVWHRAQWTTKLSLPEVEGNVCDCPVQADTPKWAPGRAWS